MPIVIPSILSDFADAISNSTIQDESVEKIDTSNITN